MTQRAYALHPRDPATVIHGAGDDYRYLATGEQTGGSYFALEATVPPGAGPPPHVQTREEEGFYVIEGTVTFWPDGEEIVAGPGTFLHVPRGVVHHFRNDGDVPARMLIWFAPAGIEEMFSAMAANPERYLEIGAEYGVSFT
ncbi:MAG: cupin domain-containing protein [Gemmatimonadota bacterium]